MIEGFKPGLSGRFKPGLKVHQRPACLLLDLSVCGRIPAGFLRAFSGVFLQRCSVTYLMEWEGFSSQDPWQILDTPLVDPWLILDPSSGILWHSLAVSTHLDWFLGLYRFVLQRNRHIISRQFNKIWKFGGSSNTKTEKQNFWLREGP